MTDILDSSFTNKDNYEQAQATKLQIMYAVTQHAEFTQTSLTFCISYDFIVEA
jgi:hypothetical protein